MKWRKDSAPYEAKINVQGVCFYVQELITVLRKRQFSGIIRLKIGMALK